MTQLIEKQHILKRKRQNSLLLLAKEKKELGKLGSEKITRRKHQSLVPGKLKGFLAVKVSLLRKKLPRGRKKNLYLGFGVAGAAVLLVFSFWYNSSALNLEISLPDDPILYSHLISYASVEFDGQGSGDILPAASALIPAVNPVNYVVQPGDTISQIAAKYGLSERTLIGYNSVTDVYRLIPGTELNIPDIDGVPYQVKEGDSLATIAGKFNVEINNILDANDLDNDLLLPGQNLFIPGARISDYEYRQATKTLLVYPSRGRLSSGYGYRADPFTGVRRFHYGIDLANSTGTSIVSSMEGTVVDVSVRSTGYGKSVIIRHANGFQTLYGHLDQILVKKNQWVNQGQLIGKMGNTGRSTGPHLHFAVYKNNSPINPLTYLFK